MSQAANSRGFRPQRLFRPRRRFVTVHRREPSRPAVVGPSSRFVVSPLGGIVIMFTDPTNAPAVETPSSGPVTPPADQVPAAAPAAPPSGEAPSAGTSAPPSANGNFRDSRGRFGP